MQREYRLLGCTWELGGVNLSDPGRWPTFPERATAAAAKPQPEAPREPLRLLGCTWELCGLLNLSDPRLYESSQSPEALPPPSPPEWPRVLGCTLKLCGVKVKSTQQWGKVEAKLIGFCLLVRTLASLRSAAAAAAAAR